MKSKFWVTHWWDRLRAGTKSASSTASSLTWLTLIVLAIKL